MLNTQITLIVTTFDSLYSIQSSGVLFNSGHWSAEQINHFHLSLCSEFIQSSDHRELILLGVCTTSRIADVFYAWEFAGMVYQAQLHIRNLLDAIEANLILIGSISHPCARASWVKHYRFDVGIFWVFRVQSGEIYVSGLVPGLPISAIESQSFVEQVEPVEVSLTGYNLLLWEVFNQLEGLIPRSRTPINNSIILLKFQMLFHEKWGKATAPPLHYEIFQLLSFLELGVDFIFQIDKVMH